MDEADRGESDRPSGEGPSEGSSPSVRLPSVPRRVLVRSLVGLVVLAGLGWTAAATGVGMGLVVPFALERLAPEGWDVELGAVDGSWLDHVEISELSLRGPDLSLEVEGLVLRYRILPLLDETVEVRSLMLDRPTVRLAVGDTARSTGVAEGAHPEDEVGAGPGSDGSVLASLLAGRQVGSWIIRAEDLRIRDGRVEIVWGADGRYSMADLRLDARAAMGLRGLSASIDTLRAEFESVLAAAPDSAFRSTGRIGLAGSLENGDLRLDTLTLESGRSHVSGAGRMAFVARRELWRQVQAEIVARPVDLRDLPVSLPEPLRRQPELLATLSAIGSPDSLTFTFDGEGFGGQTTVDASAKLRWADSADGVRDATVDAVDDDGPDSPPALEGSVSFGELDLSAWSGPPVDGAASGTVDFSLESLGAGARYTADGSVRHRPRTVDPARIVGRPLEARFDVTGRTPGDSLTATPLRVDARVTLSTLAPPGRAGPPAGRLGRVTADVTGSTAEWTAELTLDSGRVDGHGTADWSTAPRVIGIDGLRVARLDLTTVDTVYPSTDLTGRLEGRFESAPGEELEGTIDAAFGSSRFQETVVDTLSLRSEIRGTIFDGSLFARSEIGDVRSSYRVELVDSVVRFEADGLRYARADTARTDPPPVELHGRASGSWALADLRRASLSAVVDSARWSGAEIEAGTVEATLEGRRIVADAGLTVRGLLPSAMRIRAGMDAAGTTLDSITGSASVTADRVHPETPVRVDTVRVELEALEPGSFRLTGFARPGEGGAISFRGSAGATRDSLWFDVDADGAFERPSELLGGATLDSLLLTASGRRIEGRWRSAEAEIVASDAAWNRLRAERALASLRYDSMGVRLDTLDVRSNVVELFGRGSLPAAGDGGRIDLTGEFVDLEPLRELAGLEVLAAAAGGFQVSASGSVDSLDWTGDLGLEAMVVNDLRLTGVRFTGEGLMAAPRDFLFGMRSTEAELTFDRLILPESEVRRIGVRAAGGPDSIRVEAEAVVDARRTASMRVLVEPRPDRRIARIEDVRFQIDEDEWLLAEQAAVQYREGVSLEPLLLRAGAQEIRLEGGVSEEGILDLNARMDSTDVATVADLAGFPRLRGWLSGRVRIQGSTSAPEAWVDASGAFHRANRRPGPVEVMIRANGRRVRGAIQLMDAGRGRLTLSGGALLPGAGREAAQAETSGSNGRTAAADTIVFGLASDSIDVALEADSFDLRWTEALYGPDVLASLAGTLDGSLTLRGSSAEPVLDGEIGIRDGGARPTALGVSWDGLRVTLRGDGSDLVVESARISTSSGTATVRGTVGVRGSMPLDLALELDGFQAIQTDPYWAVVSGSLVIGGMVMAPEIDGELRLESLDVFLDERVTSEGLEPVELTDEDVGMLRDRFGVVPDPDDQTRPVSERLTADLEVVIGRDSWIRKRTSPEMAIPFSGSIEVRLRPGEEPTLQGSVDVIEGRGFVEQFGRRFDLSRGTVTFDGAPDRTSLDLEATYTVPSHDNPDDAEVTIILEVTGTQDDLGLTLSSTPPLENADIVSYIATGRPASGSLTFGNGESEDEGGLVAAGAGFALGQMTSLIESAAARSVGLDVVEIRREGLRQATLVAGKYVSPRLYVGFAQPISFQEGSGSEGRSELEIEYEALRWLLINIEGSGSSVHFFLRGRRAY